MKMKIFGEDTYEVIMGSMAQAGKYYHNFIGVNHMFLSLFSFLSANKDNEKYGAIYEKLKSILNKYGVTGKIFQDKFLVFCPSGMAPNEGEEIVATCDNDFNAITANLKRRAAEEGRPMNIQDLICEMFADRSYQIAAVLSEIVGSDAKADQLRDEVVQTFKAMNKPTTVKDLEEMPEMLNINNWVKEHPQHIIGADDAVMGVEMALAGKSVKSAMLTGPAGTGKTSVVYELAQRINAGNVPEFLKGKIIYECNSNALVAGTRYRGDFEQKLQNILEVLVKHPEVICFIDECHTFLKLGNGSEDTGGGAGDIIKPYVSRGDIQLIMATTNEEYNKYIAPDKAFARRFSNVLIQEPTTEELRKILVNLLPETSKYFNKEIQEELVDNILELSKKYSLELANPAKAINMLDLACAYSKVFEDAKKEVNLQDVINSIKLKYAIYISDQKLDDTVKEMKTQILGQEKAIDQIARDLTMVDKGLYDPQKPLISMLFAGPSGVGKTETAKIIARKYFGSDNNLIKINMSEYSNEVDITKLTGASAGYVGYDDEPYLLKQVKAYPNSVVLFDECEKAHPNIWKVLLNILDEGEMQDNKGNKISFRNCIIIFTSNLGCNNDTGRATGMGFTKTRVQDNSSEIMKAIENYFRPEFLGRLDDIVMFNGLPRSIIDKLTDRYVKFYADNSGLKITLTKEDYDAIAENANIDTAGARGLMKATRKRITENLLKNSVA